MVDLGGPAPLTLGAELARDPAGLAPLVRAPVQVTGKGYFDSLSGGLAGFIVKGTLLQIVTLGLYRFQYTTRLRHALWSRSGIAGDRFEYVGTAFELFVGFLMFLGVFLPIYGISFLGSLKLGLVSEVSGIVAPLAFLFLLVLASYRARRFRLSRTLYRGVRFGQSGSALGYALRWTGWMLLTLVTLGLAFPAMRAALERYRVGHTWFGDRAFASEARGPWRPFLIGYAIWILPAVVVLAMLMRDGFSLSTLVMFWMTQGVSAVESLPAAYRLPAGLAQLWIIVGPVLVYPFYRASEIRRFIGAASFGRMRFESTFGAGTIWAGWILVVLYMIGFLIVLFVGSTLLGPQARLAMSDSPNLGLAVGYGIFLSGYVVWTIARAVHLHLRVWRVSLETLTITGLDDIETVSARVTASGAFGDDFASSYDFGGL